MDINRNVVVAHKILLPETLTVRSAEISLSKLKLKKNSQNSMSQGRPSVVPGYSFHRT